VADTSDERRNGRLPDSSRGEAVESDVRIWHARLEALDELVKRLQEKEEEDERTGE
jgi:hypothetical protein